MFVADSRLSTGFSIARLWGRLLGRCGCCFGGTIDWGCSVTVDAVCDWWSAVARRVATQSIIGNTGTMLGLVAGWAVEKWFIRILGQFIDTVLLKILKLGQHLLALAC